MYRGRVALVLVFAALLAVAGPAAVATAAGGSSLPVGGSSLEAGGPSAAAPAPTQAAPAPASVAVQERPNESERVLHRHPDAAEGVGDDDAVAAWLIDELEVTLEESAVDLAEGDHEAARRLLEGTYDERLDQYAEVAGDTTWRTEDESDPRTRDEVAAEEFRAVQETQLELAEAMRQYEETLAAYEAARDRGDEQEAVELARELVALADRIEALGGELDERYARIEAVVERDLSSASAAVENATAERRTETDRVAREAFADTTLTVEVVDGTVSAADPLVVEGRLVDEDGAPIPDATIAVSDPVVPVAGDVGAATVGREGLGSGATTTVTTDDDGSFRLTHRAAYLPLSTDTLTVEYRPERLSPHRAASRPVDVAVEQVDGELEVANVPEEVAYGDEVSLGVVASAADEPVAGAPFRLRMGGATAGGTTDEQGAVELSGGVPRDLPAGEGELVVAAPLSDWSVDFERHAATVEVRETETTLTAAAEPTADGAVVSGRLETADGEPVRNAPVEVAVEGGVGDALDGQEATTVRTDADGSYRATVDAGGEEISTRYDEPDSNLAAASASAPLPSGDGGGGGPAGWLLDVLGAPLGGAVLALVLLGAGAVGLRRRSAGDDGEVAVSRTDDAARDESVPTPTDPGPDESAALLEAATEALEDSPSRATVLAYAAGRRSLADDVAADVDATHREFLEAAKEAGLRADAVDDAAELTRCYEAAAYAPGDVDRGTARVAVDAAESLQDREPETLE